jgi:hypothetical protein
MGRRGAMWDYPAWKVNLVERIERDGDTRFRIVPA